MADVGDKRKCLVGTWLLMTALLVVALGGSPAEVSANTALGEDHVLEVCWYPRDSTGEPFFFITAQVRQAKKITFFYHKRPQRGLHQGHNWSTNYRVSWPVFKKVMHRQPPLIGVISLHITLRSNRHFVYTLEPLPCTLS